MGAETMWTTQNSKYKKKTFAQKWWNCNALRWKKKLGRSALFISLSIKRYYFEFHHMESRYAEEHFCPLSSGWIIGLLDRDMYATSFNIRHFNVNILWFTLIATPCLSVCVYVCSNNWRFFFYRISMKCYFFSHLYFSIRIVDYSRSIHDVQICENECKILGICFSVNK